MDQETIIQLRDKTLYAHPSAATSFILVSVSAQKLYLVDRSGTTVPFTISTSRYGTGNTEGSFRTPLGLHRIIEKIGNNAPEMRIFRDRMNTGINWQPGMNDENLILTRILRLEGCEEGINRGPGIDSLERCIYIHGTNHEELIGTPFSHGCICMNNRDIITLFNLVPEETLVSIIA
jgi:hypothetical protein